MNPLAVETQALPLYRVRARNTHAESENRMHSDDVAAAYGFKGALVPGVAVFAQMTYPFVARHGAAWLARGSADVIFVKPAYDGELLTVQGQRNADGNYAVTCTNPDGLELARMTSRLRESPPLIDARASHAPASPREKQVATWELMEVGVPFPSL